MRATTCPHPHPDPPPPPPTWEVFLLLISEIPESRLTRPACRIPLVWSNPTKSQDLWLPTVLTRRCLPDGAYQQVRAHLLRAVGTQDEEGTT